MDNIQKLKRDISTKLNNWDERSSFTLKGVRNLSFSDLEDIKMYAEHYEVYGSFRGLMEPMGQIKEVLDAYGIIDTSYRLFG